MKFGHRSCTTVDLLHASCTDSACCSPQPSAGLSGCPVAFAQRATSANKGLTLLTPTVMIKGLVACTTPLPFLLVVIIIIVVGVEVQGIAIPVQLFTKSM